MSKRYDFLQAAGNFFSPHNYNPTHAGIKIGFVAGLIGCAIGVAGALLVPGAAMLPLVIKLGLTASFIGMLGSVAEDFHGGSMGPALLTGLAVTGLAAGTIKLTVDEPPAPVTAVTPLGESFKGACKTAKLEKDGTQLIMPEGCHIATMTPR